MVWCLDEQNPRTAITPDKLAGWLVASDKSSTQHLTLTPLPELVRVMRIFAEDEVTSLSGHRDRLLAEEADGAQGAPGPDEPGHVRQRLRRVGQVVEHRIRHHHIEALRRKIGVEQARVPPLDVLVWPPLTSAAQNPSIRIQPDHNAPLAAQTRREESVATSDIEDVVTAVSEAR